MSFYVIKVGQQQICNTRYEHTASSHPHYAKGVFPGILCNRQHGKLKIFL